MAFFMLKRIIILFIVSLFTVSSTVFAGDVPKVKRRKFKHKIHFKLLNKTEDHNKWVAAGLDLSLGLFGVHRLYLGTESHVPVMYALTLGGGGILILADLGLILFSKDMEPYSDNANLFMWSKED